MRDFQLPGRSPVYARHGMAATSHPLATLTALDVLRDEGNAIDAAVAAAAVLGVVEPQMTGIGGDCFALYAPAGGEVIALNGSGRAPARATVRWFQERGQNAIDPSSPHAVTVPGAVEAWASLVADHGRKTLGELLGPAIELAREGAPVHSRVARDWREAAERLRRDPSAERIFLPGGAPPEAGALHRQPELAATLEAIAQEGRDGFYAGPVAEDMVRHLNGLGGLHSIEDFARTRAEYVKPIRTDYRGVEVYECPPNGQGIVALIMLNILSGFDLARFAPLGAERLHLEIEAGRFAYRDRDALVADPDHASVPVERLLSAEYADELRRHVRLDRAMDSLPPSPFPAHRDTVYLSIVDRQRNAVSFINSIFDSFGSGIVAPRSGVLLHSRGASFALDPSHPNCIAPGKRPMHTIIPAMAQKGGRTVMPFGVMGAHYQPFGHVHLLTNVVDFGMDVQAAIDLPRAFYDDGQAVLEAGVPEETARGLAERGHRVSSAAKPLGGGQAIWIDWSTGVLTGGSEPRKDGCAIGY